MLVLVVAVFVDAEVAQLGFPLIVESEIPTSSMPTRFGPVLREVSSDGPGIWKLVRLVADGGEL
jgi:hypothetical protein